MEDEKIAPSGLVARERRWLDVTREDAYSPATRIFSRLRPFSFMALRLRADVKDAFLTVPQPTEIMVKLRNDSQIFGRYCLVTVLLEQRWGPLLWYNHVVTILKKMKKVTVAICPSIILQQLYAIVMRVDDQMIHAEFSKREHVLRDDWRISVSRDPRYVAKMIELAGILPNASPSRRLL